jgi:hypothetical protein
MFGIPDFRKIHPVGDEIAHVGMKTIKGAFRGKANTP